MSIHHKFSPSKLERILACPASVGLSEHLPEAPSSSYAEEGTLLHELTAECLEQRPQYDLDSVKWETPEHRFLVQQCLDEVDKILDTFTEFQLFQNLNVVMRDIDCSGTLDIGIRGLRGDGSMEYHIIDLKFGAGVEVSPIDNPQLLAYLDGFLNYLDIDYNHNKDAKFVWIFQPRLDKFESELIFAEDLSYFRGRVEKAIRLANGRNAPFHPGFMQCRWCPCGAVCKSRLAEVKQNTASILEAYADMRNWSNEVESIESLTKLLRLRSNINNAMDAIEQYLFTQLSRGIKVPGYKLVAGRARRSWATGVDAFTINELFPQLDTTDLVEAKLRSPAQVEKLLRPTDRKVLNELIVSTVGEPTMASEDSAKEAIDPYGKFKDVIGD